MDGKSAPNIFQNENFQTLVRSQDNFPCSILNELENP